MCSNADVEQDGVTLMQVKTLDLYDKWCKKCGAKNEAKVVLRKKDLYCKDCFLSTVTHKFRACLGKSKIMRPGDKVLIGFSGSNNSCALLHLIQTGLQETSHKKLMFTPICVFTDESSVLCLTPEEKKTVNESISTHLKDFGFTSYIVPIELSTMSEDVMKEYLEQGTFSGDNSVRKLFSSLTDNTSKIEMLNKLRNNALTLAANSLGCVKIFTAESSDDLAIKLLTNMSLGRGSQLPYDVGFSDDRFSSVKLIRPLRDLSKKELAYYNVFHSLSSVHVPSLSTKVDVHSSIQKLTESFLSELQDGFPSTLSTVFRVADKLSSNSDAEKVCSLCKAPLDTELVASSSLSATHFSRLVSASGPSDFNKANLKDSNSNSGCGGDGNSCPGTCSKKPVKDELQPILCYGCNLILRNTIYLDVIAVATFVAFTYFKLLDYNYVNTCSYSDWEEILAREFLQAFDKLEWDIDKLPAQFIKYLKTSSQRCKMRRDIEDFLL